MRGKEIWKQTVLSKAKIWGKNRTNAEQAGRYLFFGLRNKKAMQIRGNCMKYIESSSKPNPIMLFLLLLLQGKDWKLSGEIRGSAGFVLRVRSTSTYRHRVTPMDFANQNWDIGNVI